MGIGELLPAFCVIPALPFLMGSTEHSLSELAKRYGGTRESYREEAPQHTLELPAFAIAQVPVSNALYAAYVAATDAPAPLAWRGKQPADARRNHPVVDISWNDAQACCSWLTTQLTAEGIALTTPNGQQLPLEQKQLRLPSEAEWEHAARGSDGRTFPWGNDFDPACANTREAGNAGTTPLGSYPAGSSPYGVVDMAGNIWEWTSSLDSLYPYHPNDGREQLATAGRRILRGGCYANPQGFARCACRFRLLPTVRNEFTGFRLACSLNMQ